LASDGDYHPGNIERALRMWDESLDSAVSATVGPGTDWAGAERLCDTRADVWCALRWLASFNRPAAALVVATWHHADPDEHADDRDDRLAASRGMKRATLRRLRIEALGMLAGYLNDGEEAA
jgi:hypothetical protein